MSSLSKEITSINNDISKINDNFSDIFITRQFQTAVHTLSANEAYTFPAVDVDVIDGYTPIGIIGIANSASTGFYPYGCRVSYGKLQVSVLNTRSSSQANCAYKADILYIKDF